MRHTSWAHSSVMIYVRLAVYQCQSLLLVVSSDPNEIVTHKHITNLKSTMIG